MTCRLSALERAFELARSGKAASIDAIRTTLKREGYGVTQLVGPQLIRQLRALIRLVNARG
jgi:hypothetical protein